MSMNLSLRHMKAFCALAATRNFTRAAEQCSLTQSAFSAMISNLERGLGVKLFSRNTRNVELTAEGEVFSEMMGHLMPETERVLAEMQDYVQRRKGRVAIAALPTIFSALLPDIIAAFLAKHPGIELIIEDVASTTCVELVRNRRVDFALCASAAPGTDLIIEVLASDTFYFICRGDHSLAARKRLSATEVQKHPIIVFETASSIRQHLDASIYPRQWIQAFQVNSLSTAAGLISAGLGATIVPTLGLRQFNLPGLAAIPVTLPINRRELCLLRRKDATESVAAREFIALLKNSLAKKVEHMGTLQAVRA
ncbi:LysR family transcriptional regulator [Candidimonas humi]|jgi:DNA-binding transcriptional LysR family regulator|uniref:LysR family transcriptional regulator n=1 Tax=Candidimonas humi TaxID=683355 RepID=A0ABV8NYW4_9BURK|nr:LysR family transcriptional regulator [Candidimonas humi]MBV6306409.1 LysR family transcriptional regulator [Candidimonas humi]